MKKRSWRGLALLLLLAVLAFGGTEANAAQRVAKGVDAMSARQRACCSRLSADDRANDLPAEW